MRGCTNTGCLIEPRMDAPLGLCTSSGSKGTFVLLMFYNAVNHSQTRDVAASCLTGRGGLEGGKRRRHGYLGHRYYNEPLLHYILSQ